MVKSLVNVSIHVHGCVILALASVRAKKVLTLKATLTSYELLLSFSQPIEHYCWTRYTKDKKGRAKLNSLGQHFNTARTLVPLSEQFIAAFQVRAVEKINPVSTHNTVQR